MSHVCVNWPLWATCVRDVSDPVVLRKQWNWSSNQLQWFNNSINWWDKIYQITSGWFYHSTPEAYFSGSIYIYIHIYTYIYIYIYIYTYSTIGVFSINRWVTNVARGLYLVSPKCQHSVELLTVDLFFPFLFIACPVISRGCNELLMWRIQQ